VGELNRFSDNCRRHVRGACGRDLLGYAHLEAIEAHKGTHFEENEICFITFRKGKMRKGEYYRVVSRGSPAGCMGGFKGKTSPVQIIETEGIAKPISNRWTRRKNREKEL